MRCRRTYYVYIVSNVSRTLYVGVTNDLLRRVAEHNQRHISGFTSKYHLTLLVYFESTNDICEAIRREKQLKGWLRAKKIEGKELGPVMPAEAGIQRYLSAVNAAFMKFLDSAAKGLSDGEAARGRLPN